jgi:hypothetical protein
MTDHRAFRPHVKPYPAPPPDDLPIQFAEPEPPMVPPVMQPPADDDQLPEWVWTAAAAGITVVAVYCVGMALVSIAQLIGLA